MHAAVQTAKDRELKLQEYVKELAEIMVLSDFETKRLQTLCDLHYSAGYRQGLDTAHKMVFE